MSDAPLEIYSRIAALEFVLEVMLANDLAGQPPSESAVFKRDLVSREARLPPRSGPLDVAFLHILRQQIKTDLEAFLQKVAARESEIRAKRIQDR